MAPSKPARRKVHFETLGDIGKDVERLMASPRIVTAGNWTAAQNFDHLAIIMEKSLAGFDKQMPFFIQWPAKVLLKRRFLTQPMKAGFKIPKSASEILPSSNRDTHAAGQRLLAVLQRFDKEPQRFPHPVFGEMTDSDWRQLHCRHAELHLSFLLPE